MKLTVFGLDFDTDKLIGTLLALLVNFWALFLFVAHIVVLGGMDGAPEWIEYLFWPLLVLFPFVIPALDAKASEKLGW